MLVLGALLLHTNILCLSIASFRFASLLFSSLRFAPLLCSFLFFPPPRGLSTLRIVRGRGERYNVPRTCSILPSCQSTLPVYTGYADGARSGPLRQTFQQKISSSSSSSSSPFLFFLLLFIIIIIVVVIIVIVIVIVILILVVPSSSSSFPRCSQLFASFLSFFLLSPCLPLAREPLSWSSRLYHTAKKLLRLPYARSSGYIYVHIYLRSTSLPRSRGFSALALRAAASFFRGR